MTTSVAEIMAGLHGIADEIADEISGVGEIWDVSNLNDRFHTAEISVIPTDFTTIEISDFTTVKISDRKY